MKISHPLVQIDVLLDTETAVIKFTRRVVFLNQHYNLYTWHTTDTANVVISRFDRLFGVHSFKTLMPGYSTIGRSLYTWKLK